MNKKDKIKLEALSNIDESIVDKATEIRCFWLLNVGQKVKKSRIWLRVVSIAACICLIFGGGLFGILRFFGKQTPIYTGMTVQNNAPTVNQTAKADGALKIELLSDEDHDIDQNDPYNKGEDGENIDDSIDERFKDSIVSAKDEYFAKKNEDVYFVIHIKNPDNFVILSFTLNGTVYSSYMFEKGSDMETLILKYNVGDVEGEQSYTIDAIKYVDGNQIKDVIMEGERTVNVKIYPEEQPTVAVTEETVNYIDVSFTANIDDPKTLIELSDGKLYAMLYDGDNLIQEKEIEAGDTVKFENLKPDTLYQYALVALYDAIDGGGKKPHVLYEKAFYTQKVVELEASKFSGMDITFCAKWNEEYNGNKRFNSIALYEGDTKIRDLDVNATIASNLPFDKELSLVAEYTVDGQTFIIRCKIDSPKSSKGLAMSDGVVTGMGTCEDTVIYINAPIAPEAFYKNLYLKEVYLGENVKDIKDHQFEGCSNLKIVGIGNGIKTVGAGAFSNCPKLESVTIGVDIGRIYANAFSNCEELTTVYIADLAKWCNIQFANYASNPLGSGAKWLYLNGNLVTDLVIPQGVESIGAYAFDGYDNLASVTIPSSVRSIGSYAFPNDVDKLYITDLEKWCGIQFENYASNPLGRGAKWLYLNGNLVTDLVIPQGVDSIGAYAFYGYKFLKSVTLPNSIKTIGAGAFRSCEGLMSITIPSNVMRIDKDAFGSCYKLLEVINHSSLNIIKGTQDNGSVAQYALGVHNGESKIDVVNDCMFYTCEGVNYLTGYIGNSTSIILPDNYKGQNYEIYDYAFMRHSEFTSITIPNSVTKIGKLAFYRCSGLTSITIPDSVKRIKVNAFEQCTGLTSITLPNGITRIESGMFRLCTGLESIIIPNSVTSIDRGAFEECTGLRSIIVPDSVTSIDRGAFEECTGLRSIIIPDSVTSIGERVFSGCTSLRSIIIPDSVTSIGEYAFERTWLTSIIIPNSVTSIGVCAFIDCASLTSIIIPDSVTSIGEGVFSGCTSLTSIIIPDSVTSIGGRAFSGCTSLESINIPKSVTSIAAVAFEKCLKLTSVTFENKTGWKESYQKMDVSDPSVNATNLKKSLNEWKRS